MSSGMQRLAWTEEEDEYLIASVQKYGVKRWAQIAQGLPGRTSKACSHRWRTYLAPGVKHTSTDPFTDWEIAVVQEAHKQVGNNWSAIAKMLPGRTNAAVKNFWYAHKRRQQRAMEKAKMHGGKATSTSTSIMALPSDGCPPMAPKDPSSSALVRHTLGGSGSGAGGAADVQEQAAMPAPGAPHGTSPPLIHSGNASSSDHCSNSPHLSSPSGSTIPGCVKSPHFTSSSNLSWASHAGGIAQRGSSDVHHDMACSTHALVVHSDLYHAHACMGPPVSREGSHLTSDSAASEVHRLDAMGLPSGAFDAAPGMGHQMPGWGVVTSAGGGGGGGMHMPSGYYQHHQMHASVGSSQDLMCGPLGGDYSPEMQHVRRMHSACAPQGHVMSHPGAMQHAHGMHSGGSMSVPHSGGGPASAPQGDYYGSGGGASGGGGMTGLPAAPHSQVDLLLHHDDLVMGVRYPSGTPGYGGGASAYDVSLSYSSAAGSDGGAPGGGPSGGGVLGGGMHAMHSHLQGHMAPPRHAPLGGQMHHYQLHADLADFDPLGANSLLL